VIANVAAAGGAFLVYRMLTAEETYREKIETTARARVFWGDPEADIVKYLADNGTEQGEAKLMVEAFIHERADTVRKMGLRKILIGIPLVTAPLLPWIILSTMMHRLFMPPIMILCLPGSFVVYGLYSLFKGILMYVWPDTQAGDIAEAD
jgi:hypothetical protein